MKKKAKGKAVSKRARKQPKGAKVSSTMTKQGAGLVSADIRKAYKNRLISEYFQRQV
jgi:hypothetical protein